MITLKYVEGLDIVLFSDELKPNLQLCQFTATLQNRIKCNVEYIGIFACNEYILYVNRQHRHLV